MLADLINLIIPKVVIAIPGNKELGHLYLGSVRSLDGDILSRLQIDVVISLIVNVPQLPDHIIHLIAPIRDCPCDQALMSEISPILTQEIHQRRLEGKNILIHCRSGLHRAPTIIVHYLQRYYQYTTIQALYHVQTVRPWALWWRQPFRLEI